MYYQGLSYHCFALYSHRRSNIRWRFQQHLYIYCWEHARIGSRHSGLRCGTLLFQGLATATWKICPVGQRHYLCRILWTGNNSPTPDIGRHTMSLCNNAGQQGNCSQYHKGMLVPNMPNTHCKRASWTKYGDAKIISSLEWRTRYTTSNKLSIYKAADSPQNSVKY